MKEIEQYFDFRINRLKDICIKKGCRLQKVYPLEDYKVLHKPLYTIFFRKKIDVCF